MNEQILLNGKIDTEAYLEIVAVEGRLEFGFWGWLEGAAKAVWHWFSHCSGTFSGSTSISGSITCHL